MRETLRTVATILLGMLVGAVVYLCIVSVITAVWR